jgi:hypothetical protein
MIITYLFVDDDAGSDAPAELYADAFERAANGVLKIETIKPASLDAVLQEVAARGPGGLLLDLSFINATHEGRPLAFDGISLAQQIRTLQTRRSVGSDGLAPFPIIRVSKQDVVREYVAGDTTSDDLFDEKLDKDTAIDGAEQGAALVVALATDYPRVTKLAASEKSDAHIAEALGVSEEIVARLDPRILIGFQRPEAPPHVFARYLISGLLRRPGPLVAEDVLAVRLGIDCQRSPDWKTILDSLKGIASYQGAFSAGYTRWWMLQLLDWWSQTVSSDLSPQRLSAAQRVELLSHVFGTLKLSPIAEDPLSPGNKFWHICGKSGRPVDPSKGFPLMPVYGQEAWHDADYLSEEEALRDVRNRRLRPAERTRLLSLREQARR